MTSEAADILVVGGGIAGLVAARRLALAGRGVTVFEAADRFGGQVRSVRLDGTDVDAGAESFATRGGTVARLLDELGLEAVAPAPGPAWLQPAEGAAAPLPATALLGIPADPGAPDVVRILGHDGALRASDDARLPPTVGADATTLGELVRERMGSRVLDDLVAPVVRGVYSREPDDLPLDGVPGLRERFLAHGSLAAAVADLRAAAPAGSQVAGIRGGMFRLTDALVEACARAGATLLTGTRVEEVARDSVVVDGVRTGGTVVLAAPHPGDHPAARRVTLVLLVVPASAALDAAPRGSGVLVAAGAPGIGARALTHVTAKWPWLRETFPRRHLLRLSYDGVPSAPLARAEADAARLLGAPIGPVLAADAVTWDRVAGALRTPDDGLPRAGEGVAGTGLAAVVAQAEAVAADVLGDSRGGATRGRMDA